MAELKPKGSQPKEETVQPKEEPIEETVPVPIEVSSAKNGIQITIEGGFITLSLSQYMAEHIGQFRACTRVVCKFKDGQAPDIAAYHEHGM